MAAAQAAPALAADALCCLGLGFLLGALYDLARFLLGDRRAACFAADVGAFCLAAVLLCSFSASRSRAGTVRWYMAAALLAGDMGYFSVLAPATRTLEGWIKWPRPDQLPECFCPASASAPAPGCSGRFFFRRFSTIIKTGPLAQLFQNFQNSFLLFI